jgi:hypothetical protein
MITETRANPDTGEVYTTREWDCLVYPEKNQPGAHGLNLLADCEALLSNPDFLSNGERQFVEYVVRARIKTRRYLPGHLIAMLSDAHVAHLKIICKRAKILAAASYSSSKN